MFNDIITILWGNDCIMELFNLQNVMFNVNQQTILQNISMVIPKNSFTVLTGPSGSGKSTLLKLLGSLLSPTSGTIEYQGQPIDRLKPTEYRQQVSYCVQTPVLFGKTVADNLRFPFEIRHLDFDVNHADLLLSRVGLAGFMNKSIHEISGGEKQRVALIRNVMFYPKVLLLDEITSALDEDNKAIIWKFIGELHHQHQISVISVTHQQAEIKQATHVIMLKEGRVITHES